MKSLVYALPWCLDAPRCRDDQGENGPRQTSVPEPGTTLLLARGLGGVAAFQWWRRHHAA
jgi:hypothetical protein